jgi:hypothetical protein
VALYFDNARCALNWAIRSKASVEGCPWIEDPHAALLHAVCGNAVLVFATVV